MLTHPRIADQTLSAIGARLEKGRDALSTFVSSTPGAMGIARRHAPSRAPLWIGAGLLMGVASIVLSSRRQRESLDGAGRCRLRDVMITEVQTIEPDTTVVEAAEQMRLKNVGVLPIVENDHVIGVITDRDLVIRVLAKRGADPATIRVVDCATKNPMVARADWTPERALLVMADQQIGRLPVVDDTGRLIGMVTLSSLALRSQKPEETLAAARKVSLRSAREDAA